MIELCRSVMFSYDYLLCMLFCLDIIGASVAHVCPMPVGSGRGPCPGDSRPFAIVGSLVGPTYKHNKNGPYINTYEPEMTLATLT